MDHQQATIQFSTEEITRAIGVKPIKRSSSWQWISEIVIDTRTAFDGPKSLFIALKGNMSDGNDFALIAHQKGIRTFVLSSTKHMDQLEDSTIFVVKDAVKTLQMLARYKRIYCAHTKVISITGSAGKTIVKEWLTQCLSAKYATVQSPKSYNSQIGVPLSVWNMQPYHQIGIFEAGISRPGEMENLRLVIQPEIGILTNIGSAHDAGFKNRKEKLEEKLQLFAGCRALIFNGDAGLTEEIHNHLNNIVHVTWSRVNSTAFIFLDNEIKSPSGTQTIYYHKGKKHELHFPFSDEASLENAYHVLTTLLYLGEEPDFVSEKMKELKSIPLRLEVSNITGNVTVINDAYINDLSGLKIALDFASRYVIQRRLILILSDIADSGFETQQLEEALHHMLQSYHVEKVFYLSAHELSHSLRGFSGLSHYTTIESLKRAISSTQIKDAVVLIKGARKYGLESIFYMLKQKSHTARLTISLPAIEHNVAYYKQLTKPETKMMAVIKGSAYGSGAEAIAHVLQHKGVNYLSVANIDEGKQLRAGGITMPLIILNPDGLFAEELIQHDLQVEIYSILQLENLISELYSINGKVKIHLKLDTGMHRLGMMPDDFESLIHLLKNNMESIHVESIFSHLTSSEDPDDDVYTQKQFELFDSYYEIISGQLGFRPIKHILNTAGIARFGERNDDLVRIGLGLYGIDATSIHDGKLEKAHELTASIIQVKKIKAGDFVGYNRRGMVSRDSRIAIVNIGYADGFLRNAGNGRYALGVEGQRAPILGNVCMDLTIIDITDIPDAKEGSLVTIFGQHPSIEELAKACQTIPYEIISRIAPRVVREYVY